MSEQNREASSQEDWQQNVSKTTGKGGFIPRKDFGSFKFARK